MTRSFFALTLSLQMVAGLTANAQAPASDTPPPPAPAASGVPDLSLASTKESDALRRFGSFDDDRARVFLASGEPDARQVVSCPDLFRPVEIWTYLSHPTLGTNARLVFFRETGTANYRYWTVLEGESVLLQSSIHKPIAELAAGSDRSSCSDLTMVNTALDGIRKRQGDNNGGLNERSALAVPHAPVPSTAAAPAPPLLVSNKPLAGKERRKLLEALPSSYRKFLDDVEPICTDLERDTFLRLGTDYQRDRFVEDFWRRRSLDSDGLRVPFKDIYELRLQQVKDRFRNINTDQGRIFLVNGPPDFVKKIDCQDIYYPLEIWFYERMESIRASKVLLLFYQQMGVGDYRMWTPMDGQQAIMVGSVGGITGATGSIPRDVRRCMEYRDVLAAINTVSAQMGSMAMKVAEEMKTAQKPDSEGVDHVLQMTTDIAEDARKLPIQRVLRFPEMAVHKVRMELVVMLERETLTKKQLGEETFYDIDVVGEVIKGARLVDNFRYRFDFPASSVSGPFIPLTVERELYPGEYQLKVKVADSNQNAAALISEKLKVPEVPDVTFTAEEKAARDAARAAITRLQETPGARGSISLVPIARELATGLIRFETRTSSADIAFAEFFLNNTKMITRRRPPFDVDLDLGTLPRKHVVKVIGYSKDGKPIAEDELVLNEGREAFRLRIVSPERGFSTIGATRVVADVAVPETKKLKDIQFFVNDNRVATLYQPPFQQVVDVPSGKDLGFLRVVATLDDGTSTEDIRYFNAPKYLSEVNVQAVELYTSVFHKGKPVTGLGKESFAVIEDGVPQNLDGFEVVTNLPLSLGVGVDTSGSMEESIVDVQKAAVEFLKDVMTKKDRCFLVSFDNEPQLVSRFTTDRDKLAQALAGLRAQGSTALWDAVVYGLYQYQGTKGRKAYVILTDGADRASKFTFDAALDYAKKTGVSIYFIGMKIGATQLEVKYKLNKMSRETGGAVYYVDSAKAVANIYKEIEEELRSQYLLSYVPQNKSVSNAWRKIEVRMTPTNLAARTISGYYP